MDAPLYLSWAHLARRTYERELSLLATLSAPAAAQLQAGGFTVSEEASEQCEGSPARAAPASRGGIHSSCSGDRAGGGGGGCDSVCGGFGGSIGDLTSPSLSGEGAAGHRSRVDPSEGQLENLAKSISATAAPAPATASGGDVGRWDPAAAGIPGHVPQQTNAGIASVQFAPDGHVGASTSDADDGAIIGGTGWQLEESTLPQRGGRASASIVVVIDDGEEEAVRVPPCCATPLDTGLGRTTARRGNKLGAGAVSGAR